MLLDWRLTSEEKAVQRKMRYGTRLEKSDHAVVQARLRHLQKRNLYVGATAIPGAALSKRVGLNVATLTSSMQSSAAGMAPGGSGPPNMSTLGPEIEPKRADIEQGGTGSFSKTITSYEGVNMTWTVSGSFGCTNVRSVSSGGGQGGATTGGGTGHGSGSGSGTTDTSGYGVSASGGRGSGASVSVPTPGGGTAGGGASQSAGAGAGYSSTTTESQSSSASSSGSTNAGNSSSGGTIRESYFGNLVCNYTLAFEANVTWYNPASWGAGIGDAIYDNGDPTSFSVQCGTVEFMVDEPA